MHTMHPRTRPQPGSLPLRKDDPHKTLPPEVLHIQRALPQFLTEEPPLPLPEIPRKEAPSTLTTLRKARAKAEKLAVAARTDAFDDWIRRCVVMADGPREWTQARPFYESYLKHARAYGDNRTERRLSVQELRPRPNGAA